jgi:hypothetical protein
MAGRYSEDRHAGPVRYMVLIQSNGATAELFSALDDDARKVEFQRYWDIEEALTASGELLDSKAVEPTDQRVVHRTADGVAVSDAPPPEAIPALAGYYLVDVADEQRAIEIAAGFPEAAVAGGVRVARVWTAEDFAALGM